MPARKLSDSERHRHYVDSSATALDECWPWTGYLDPKGYGRFSRGSRTDGSARPALSHRFALEQALARPLVPGMQALHACDNPACCRNDDAGFYAVPGTGILRVRRGHLWEGTVQDNIADMLSKGRGARGEGKVSSAILTESAVREVRNRAAVGERAPALAFEYGVSAATVWDILHFRTWKHLAS